MVFTVLIMIHVLICVALIIVVLMQSAKGEGLAGAFGGGGMSGAVFGGRGAASFLSKATTVLAVVYMVSCLGLSFMSAGRGELSETGTESAVTRAAQQAQQEALQQQQATQEAGDQGQTGNAEDIFTTPAASDSN